MAKATYTKTSPYYNTNTFGGKFLDLLVYRKIDKQADDVNFTINSTYQYRPDLLAFDLYGDTSLWWVFRARNPNTLDDPIFDFRAGVSIYVPKKTTLVTNLGI
jgi:Base plate wedge protein 53